MLSVAKVESGLDEKKLTKKKENLEIKILSHAETKCLQDAVRIKYKKAFDLLKDK